MPFLKSCTVVRPCWWASCYSALSVFLSFLNLFYSEPCSSRREHVHSLIVDFAFINFLYLETESLLHYIHQVHEKEFLLKDLMTEGLLGGDRRLGEVCSKRIYRILMAESGTIKTDDVENGADFFSRNLLN